MLLPDYRETTTAFLCQWHPGQSTDKNSTVLGRRAFRVCGPATWNTLPTELRTATVCPLPRHRRQKNWKLVCLRAVTESALDDID